MTSFRAIGRVCWMKITDVSVTISVIIMVWWWGQWCFLKRRQLETTDMVDSPSRFYHAYCRFKRNCIICIIILRKCIAEIWTVIFCLKLDEEWSMLRAICNWYQFHHSISFETFWSVLPLYEYGKTLALVERLALAWEFYCPVPKFSHDNDFLHLFNYCLVSRWQEEGARNIVDNIHHAPLQPMRLSGCLLCYSRVSTV